MYQPIQTICNAQQRTVTIQRRHSHTRQSLMRIDCLENLQATHYCLQTAYQKKENITREQAFAAFLDVYLPDDFHNYLKDFPVNHPLALYCYNYRNVVMDLYDTHKDPLAYEKIY